ncbi:MAG: hypothetical protein INR71_00920 [Terriglobus roseus]|nr:hypothetical protein [Terriglobus roseus]
MRSYKELKKEKQSLEAQVADLEGRTRHHDDHLRVIDAWLSQVRLAVATFFSPYDC